MSAERDVPTHQILESYGIVLHSTDRGKYRGCKTYRIQKCHTERVCFGEYSESGYAMLIYVRLDRSLRTGCEIWIPFNFFNLEVRFIH